MSSSSKQKRVEAPENSIALRVTSALITVSCVTVACLYAEMPPFQIFIYVWFAITGSYASYYLRNGKYPWMTAAIVAGLLFVIYLFARELFGQFNLAQLGSFAPFLHVIAGMLTVHTFDLQTRSDINVSTILALLLFTMTAVVGRDLLFGFFVLALVILGSALLYFEAVARTKANQGLLQTRETEIITQFPSQSRRMASGSAVLPIAALPLLTVILFAFLPRVDSILDVLVARFHPSPIKMDDKGLNFIAGTGSSPGAGNRGSGPINSGANNGEDANKKSANSTGHLSSGSEKNGSEKNSASSKIDDSKIFSNEKKSAIVDETKKKKGSESAPDKSAAGSGGASKTSKDGNDKSGNGNGGSSKSKSGAADKSDGLDKDSKNSDASTNGDKNNQDNKNNKNKSKGTDDRIQAEANLPNTPQKPHVEQSMGENDELVFRNQESAEGESDVFMTVRADQPVYLKRMIFDHYDGQHWVATVKKPPAICEKTESGWTELGGVPQLFVPSGQKTTKVEQVITATVGLGKVIPAADIVQRVDMGEKSTGTVSVDDYGVLRYDQGINKNAVFKVESKIPVYDTKAMRSASNNPELQKKEALKQPLYLQIPENLPPEVVKLTQSIVFADENWFSKADRICQHLRTHYKYSFDVYKANKDEDLISRFLFKKKEGACGEFASAFVIMCRISGVPARCVGGYGPGTPDGRTGRREIRGSDGHAWGEVFIPDSGWVPFDATPTGVLPEAPPEDTSWLAMLKRNFDQANAAFKHSQADPNLGRGSEEDYKVEDKKGATGNSQKNSQKNSGADSAKGSQSGNATADKSVKEQSGSAAGRDGRAMGINESANAKTDKGKGPNFGNIMPGQTNASDKKAETEAQTESTKEKVANKSFVLTWQVIAVVLALIPGAFLVVRFILARLNRREGDVRFVNGMSPSTALYLKMNEDLKRLKVLRRPSDTTDELTQRFCEIVESDERIHPELEGLFKQFINIYAEERFGEEGHNAENYKQLREIGTRIHTLSRARTDKSRN